MSVILAIDGSGDTFSAALGRSGDAPQVKTCADKPHAQSALPIIQELLSEQGLSLQSCDAFAFAAGPGKFSALRLVCALARSFAYAMDKPLLAVPSFAALAQANFGEQPLTVKCALPAQQQHVYAARCQFDSGQWRIVRQAAVHHCDAAPTYPRIRHACGAGYVQYPQMLGDAVLSDVAAYSHAKAVWKVAVTMLATHDTSDPLTCQPFYVRRHVAQTIHQRQCKQTPSKN